MVGSPGVELELLERLRVDLRGIGLSVDLDEHITLAAVGAPTAAERGEAFAHVRWD